MNYTKCWLDYKKLPEEKIRSSYSHPVLLASGEIAETAAKEYQMAMKEMLGESVEVSYEIMEEPSVCMEVDPEYSFPEHRQF